MPVCAEDYRTIGRAAAGAVCVAAAYNRDSDAVVALTASSFVTMSLAPPMVMFAIQRNTGSYGPMVATDAFGISILSHEQSRIATMCARRGRDKCEGMQFVQGNVLRVPLIPEALAQIECSTSQIFVSGDHGIVVGIVEGANVRPGRPLLYFGGAYGSFVPLDVKSPAVEPLA